MPVICLFEDEGIHRLEPFDAYYPCWDLLVGTGSLGELIPRVYPNATFLGTTAGKKVSDNRKSAVTITDRQSLPRESILFINGRVLDPWTLSSISTESEPAAYYNGEELVAVRMSLQEPLAESISALTDVAKTLPRQEVTVPIGRFMWDYIYANGARIAADAARLTLGVQRGTVHERAVLVAPENIALGEGSIVSPGAVLDATKGPIIIGNNAKVGANSVLLGPLFLGDGATINPLSYVRPDTSIGENAKVGGEISSAIIMPESNKQHYGYFGKSYLGSWCNIGAGASTSNLKNTYGEIAVEQRSGRVESGRDSLGACIGHHVKIGSSLSLSPGAIVGSFSNIMGTGSQKRFPPFTWKEGEAIHEYNIDKAVEVAQKAMARHKRECTEDHVSAIRSLAETAG